MRGGVILQITVLFLLLVPVAFAQNNVMTLEIDVTAKSETTETISIEVPEYLHLGTVEEGGISDKFQVYVNNSGNVDIVISPLLEDPNDAIFKNLYFQSRQSGNNSQIFGVSSYSFEIAKPTSTKRSEYFWMWLDLGGAQNIDGDISGKKINVTFVALKKV